MLGCERDLSFLASYYYLMLLLLRLLLLLLLLRLLLLPLPLLLLLPLPLPLLPPPPPLLLPVAWLSSSAHSSRKGTRGSWPHQSGVRSLRSSQNARLWRETASSIVSKERTWGWR